MEQPKGFTEGNDEVCSFRGSIYDSLFSQNVHHHCLQGPNRKTGARFQPTFRDRGPLLWFLGMAIKQKLSTKRRTLLSDSDRSVQRTTNLY